MRLCVISGVLAVASAHDPITYGSAVKILSEASSGEKKFFLASLGVQWNGRPEGVNVVTTMPEEAKPEVYWTIVSGSDEKPSPSGVPVKCGSNIRLLHGMTKKFLYASRQFTAKLSGKPEAAASGSPDSKEKTHDFSVECTNDTWEMHSAVRFKHSESDEYLSSFSGLQFHPHNCPGCPMIGHREAVLSKDRNSDSTWSVDGGIILSEPTPTVETAESVDYEGRDEL